MEEDCQRSWHSRIVTSRSEEAMPSDNFSNPVGDILHIAIGIELWLNGGTAKDNVTSSTSSRILVREKFSL